MALTPSNMLPLGTVAPDFRLPDPSGRVHALRDFASAPALLIAFICNHCPYVKHIKADFARLAREYQAKGVAVVAINANDWTKYPDDSPAAMAKDAADFGYTFPYLVDETQSVARAYDAACTPDFYLFDLDRRLVYRGQIDDSRPGNGLPVTGADLTAAVDALLEGGALPPEQKPSIGCNIKWRSV